MYELKQGSKRIVNALYDRIEDNEAIKRLALITNYLPSQLREDIQALYDFLLLNSQEED